ncbi:flagellar motor switch protein FliM, partial [bacterium]|nr:flagellar motor switch protein FliM [bacterium]
MSQVLSQAEIDSLLQGVDEGEVETETDHPLDEDEFQSYDLTSQERIIRGRMPTLEIINQRFARVFRTSLSTLLHKVIDVSPL